jgi:hypothetical protein
LEREDELGGVAWCYILMEERHVTAWGNDRLNGRDWRARAEKRREREHVKGITRAASVHAVMLVKRAEIDTDRVKGERGSEGAVQR